MKTRSWKSRKIAVFPNALTHGFLINMAIFRPFCFRQNRPGKFLLRYSRTNKGLSRLWKQKVGKVKKLTFFHFSIFPFFPWFWYENGHFSNLFFLGKIGQENVFDNILERIKAFLGYENKKLKKSKNWHFFKGVNPWFWYQNGHFSNLFF